MYFLWFTLKRKFKTNRNKNGLVFRLVDTRPHTLEEVKKKISEVRKYYEEMGVPVMSFDTPEAPAEMNEKEKYAYYMGEDIKRLLMCDAIVICEGWNKSKGCCLEFHAASIYGLEQYGRLEYIPKANGHE